MENPEGEGQSRRHERPAVAKAIYEVRAAYESLDWTIWQWGSRQTPDGQVMEIGLNHAASSLAQSAAHLSELLLLRALATQVAIEMGIEDQLPWKKPTP